MNWHLNEDLIIMAMIVITSLFVSGAIGKMLSGI